MSGIFSIIGDHVARVAVTDLVDEAVKTGAQVPCDRHLLIDLTAHALESACRTLDEHVARSGLDGPSELVMVGLALKVMGLMGNGGIGALAAVSREELAGRR